MVATTHQVLQFYKRFSLAILDGVPFLTRAMKYSALDWSESAANGQAGGNDCNTTFAARV